MKTQKLKSGLFGFFAAVLMISISFTTAHASADYVPGELIVKYKPDADRSNDSVDALYDKAGVEYVEYFSETMSDFEHLFLEDNADLREAIKMIESNPDVEYAQPNFILRLPRAVNNEIPCIPGFEIPGCTPIENPGEGGLPIPCIPGFEIPGCTPIGEGCIFPGFPPGCEEGGGGGGPNPGKDPELKPAPELPKTPMPDPREADLWGIKKIDAKNAWERVAKGLKPEDKIVVAVIDTGIDYNHEDLANNIWRNPSPTNGDLVGYDFFHNDGMPFDDQGHGTHCAGTIAGVGYNGKGVIGVAARNVEIMGLKFLSKQGQGSATGAIKAIEYAIENGAKIMSNSWGGKGITNKALSDAIQKAEDAGILFVAAAGNDGKDNDQERNAVYPASFGHESILAVAATDNKDVMAKFSSFGKTRVDVAAPGVDVWSSKPGNNYAKHSGTSMATPHVAGVAALVWLAHPTWDQMQVKKAIMDTVDPVPGLKDKIVTEGRVNALNAIGI